MPTLPGLSPTVSPGRVSVASVAIAGVLALSGPQILQYLWSLVSSFLGIVLSGVSGAFDYVLCGQLVPLGSTSCPGGLAGALSEMFAGWGNALGGYGIFGPMMTLLSLGMAGLVAVILMDIAGEEQGVLQDESEI